jgi:hypothetical protein
MRCPRRSLLKPALLVCALLLPTILHARKKNTIPISRWTAGAPGCSFELGDDGRYRWTMSDKDLEMSLLVDSQELTKSRRRFYHVFGVYTTLTYKGQGHLDYLADLRLDFVRHHGLIEGYWDPNELQVRLQNDLDTLVFETERQIKKNPAIKEEKTAYLQRYEKEGAEFLEFLTTQYLAPGTLNPGNPETHGWVFFPTTNKWIGPWKPHEDFILEVRMKDRTWQFPFSLPPRGDDIILRKPPE